MVVQFTKNPKAYQIRKLLSTSDSKLIIFILADWSRKLNAWKYA